MLLQKKVSWAGKSITSKKELGLKKTKIDGLEIFLLDGTPADCAQVGIYNILKKPPKIVVSGINNGPNIGRGRILSSGTVGAAIEASIMGVKAIASSYCLYPNIYGKTKKKIDYYDPRNYPILKNATEITVKLVKILIEKDFGKDIDLFSINIPHNATIDSNFEMTRLFRDSNWKLFHKKNNKFIHRTPFFSKLKDLQEGTDLRALEENKISITPINLDLLSEKSLKKFKQTIKEEW